MCFPLCKRMQWEDWNHFLGDNSCFDVILMSNLLRPFLPSDVRWPEKLSHVRGKKENKQGIVENTPQLCLCIVGWNFNLRLVGQPDAKVLIFSLEDALLRGEHRSGVV